MTPKLKIVFDTNIYISAILFGGNPRLCLELAREGDIQLYSSRKILLELAEKLREKFLWQEEDILEALEGLLVSTKLVKPEHTVSIIKQDVEDNRILECAETTNADFIVSGDKKHLLSLRNYKGIPILSAKAFLDYFYNK